MIAQAIEDGIDPEDALDSFDMYIEGVDYFRGAGFGTTSTARVDDTEQFVLAYEKDPWKPHMLPDEYRIRERPQRITPRTSKDMFSYVNDAARRFGGGGSGSGGGSSTTT